MARAKHENIPFGCSSRTLMLRQQLAVCGQYSSIFGDHEVSQLPGVLIGFDLDLLRLLVQGQLACRQHGARTLSIGREHQLDGADAVVPGTRTPIQFAEGKDTIGNETESTPVLRG